MESFVERMERQYTADLENDDADDIDDEDEVADYAAPDNAEQFRNRKRTARQSTIVQVNTGALEIHLRQMKKQLARHEEELSRPVWMKDLQDQLKKIPVLERRLEHCQLDVDNLRDINFSTQRHEDIEKDMIVPKSIQTEIESIRMIIRRVDIQNSFEAGIFEKVADLQKSVSDLLKAQRSGIVKNELMKLQDNLQGQINSVLQRVDEVDDGLVSLRSWTAQKVLESDKNITEKMEVDAEEYKRRFSAIDARLQQVLASAEANVRERVEDAIKMTSHLSRGVMARSLRTCLRISQRAWDERNLAVLRMSFRYWQEYDPMGLLRRGRRALQLWSRAGKNYEVKCAFAFWLSHHRLQCLRERFTPHLQSILIKWKTRSIPTAYTLFHKWKRMTILSKVTTLQHQLKDSSLCGDEISLRIPQAGEGETSSLIPDNSRDLQYEELIQRLNPEKDPLGPLHLSGLTLRFLNDHINRHESDIEKVRGLISGVSNSVDRNHAEHTHMLSTKIEAVESSHSYYRTAMNGHITRIKQDAVNHDNKFMNITTDISTRLSSVDGNVRALQERMDCFFEKMERLYGLHGDMLTRMEAMDSVSSTHATRLDHLEAATTSIEKNTDSEREKYQESRNKLDDSLGHLNSEIKSCRNSTRFMASQIEEILSKESKSFQLLSSLQHDFQSDVANIENKLDMFLPSPPSADEIAGICICYEDKAVEDHSKGLLTNHLQLSEVFSDAIAKSAHNLAHHVVKSADIDVLKKYIRGSEPAYPVVDPTDHHKDKASTSIGGAAGYTFLESFMESFVESVECQRPDGGAIRKEARRNFVLKFVDSVDIVLSRLDSIVLEAPSALGRNYDISGGRDQSGACIACDRPLRMRVTKNRTVKLKDRLCDVLTPILNQSPSDPRVLHKHKHIRPSSAGVVSQSRQCRDDKEETGFVKRGGFKSRLSESMSQEKLVVELLKKFPPDVSFPVSGDTDIQSSTVGIAHRND